MEIITKLPIGTMTVETSEAQVVDYAFKDKEYGGHLYKNQIVYPCIVKSKKQIWHGFTSIASFPECNRKEITKIDQVLFDRDSTLIWDEKGVLIHGSL